MLKELEKFINDNKGVKTEQEYNAVRLTLHDLADKHDGILVALKDLMMKTGEPYGYPWRIFYHILRDEKFTNESARKILLDALNKPAPHNARTYAMHVLDSHYDSLEDFERMYKGVKHDHIRYWLGYRILEKQLEKSAVKDGELLKHAYDDNVDRFGYLLYVRNKGDISKSVKLMDVLRKSQCISDYMKMHLDRIMIWAEKESKYIHECKKPNKINYNKKQEKLSIIVRSLLVKHKDDIFDEYDDYEIIDVLKKLAKRHDLEDLVIILKDCMFDLVGSDKKDPKENADSRYWSIYNALYMFTFDEFKSQATDDALLEIFDKHPNSEIRHRAMNSLGEFHHLRSELEKRYAIEKDSFVKHYLGCSILSMHAREAGLRDEYNLTRIAREGNEDKFTIRLAEYTIKEQKQQLEFLKNSKLVPDHMKAHADSCLQKLERV